MTLKELSNKVDVTYSNSHGCYEVTTAVSTTTNQTTWSNMKTYFVYTSMSGE